MNCSSSALECISSSPQENSLIGSENPIGKQDERAKEVDF
jgi:hypothetical protein